VLEAPGRGPWGRYRLGKPDVDGALPYDVRLWSLEPPSGSCDCPDFVRGSLGVCKHLAAVMMHLGANTRGLQRVLRTPPGTPPPFSIMWDPVAGSDGTDPLASLCLSRPPARERSQVPTVLGLLFRTEERGEWRLRSTHPEKAQERLRVV